MAISKVIYKSSSQDTGTVWMDATPATAAAADITAPKTAMLADGVLTTGTGSGGGVSYGTFTVVASTLSNCGYITYHRLLDTSGNPTGIIVSIPRALKSPIHTTTTGQGIIESDGYMYVGFFGASDKYDPWVTATNGTAVLIKQTSVNSGYDGADFVTYVNMAWYKISDGAVLSFRTVDNS